MLSVRAGASAFANLRALLDRHPDQLHVRNPKRSFVAGAEVGQFDEGSLLQCAAKHGHLDIVRLLVERGAKVYPNPKSSYPPVIIAAWNKHQAVVDYFLKEIPDQASDTNKLGVTVAVAAREGWTDLVRRHIEADPLCVHQCCTHLDSGQTPLFWSAHNGHVDIVELLLAANADIEADCLCPVEIRYGGKPLHWASEHEPATVEILLKHGADPNSRNVMTGHDEEEAGENRLMIGNGFTPLTMNASNRAPVYEGNRCIGEHTDCGCFKDDCAEVTELLLAAGADINATDAKGKTALVHALEAGNQRITEVLRRHNASE